MKFDFLASLCSRGDWFESRFAGDPEDKVCHDEAHIGQHSRFWCVKPPLTPMLAYSAGLEVIMLAQRSQNEPRHVISNNVAF